MSRNNQDFLKFHANAHYPRGHHHRTMASGASCSTPTIAPSSVCALLRFVSLVCAWESRVRRWSTHTVHRLLTHTVVTHARLTCWSLPSAHVPYRVGSRGAYRRDSRKGLLLASALPTVVCNRRDP